MQTLWAEKSRIGNQAILTDSSFLFASLTAFVSSSLLLLPNVGDSILFPVLTVSTDDVVGFLVEFGSRTGGPHTPRFFS